MEAKGLISYRDALGLVLQAVPPPGRDAVRLDSAGGRVLARAVIANRDLPPFDRSSVDGFALCGQGRGSGPKRFGVVGAVRAGEWPEFRLQPGEAARVMTGAPCPDGTDCVQFQEETRVEGDEAFMDSQPQSGANLIRRGGECAKGAVVLGAGRLIGAGEIAVLATFGVTEVEVFRVPKAAILSTGDELVEVEEEPGPGRIRDSNSRMLAAQLEAIGLLPRLLPILRDDPAQIRQGLEKALSADLIILSGGVSVGDFDYVQRLLEAEGVETVFHRVAIKPGKPVYMGRKADRLVFGLPGNPVSAFVTFELFVRPAVRRWTGLDRAGPVRATGTLTTGVSQRPGRLSFRPGRTAFRGPDLEVTPVSARGSADIVAFSTANSLFLIPPDRELMQSGASVEVILLERFFEEGGRIELHASG